MRVHYTIMDRNGDGIVGGIARGRFKEETKTVQDVIDQVAPIAHDSFVGELQVAFRHSLELSSSFERSRSGE
jgi:hypothetical protein